MKLKKNAFPVWLPILIAIVIFIHLPQDYVLTKLSFDAQLWKGAMKAVNAHPSFYIWNYVVLAVDIFYMIFMFLVLLRSDRQIPDNA